MTVSHRPTKNTVLKIGNNCLVEFQRKIELFCIQYKKTSIIIEAAVSVPLRDQKEKNLKIIFCEVKGNLTLFIYFFICRLIKFAVLGVFFSL